MPFNRDSRATLISRAQSDLDGGLEGTDARLRRSNTRAIAVMHGLAMDAQYGYLDWIARQPFPETADAENLLRIASLWLPVPRYDADFASGPVIFTGTNGRVIAAGTVVQRSDGAQYATAAEVTITSGTATATVTALTAGIAGNTIAGSRLTLVSPISDVASVATVGSAGLTGGTDIESLDSVVIRLRQRLQKPPQGGADYDYVDWAFDVPGVTRAWVYPKELGPGTVTVRFAMDGTYAGGIPLTGDCNTVAAYIASRRPVTADVYVPAPVADPINFTIGGLAPSNSAVRAAIAANLADLIRREGSPGGMYSESGQLRGGGLILRSHLEEAISVAADEYDHRLISPATNVQSATGRLPTMGTITWT
jgi:uncharacterized phage protein gp47/JayE